jgi:hypothetical protein
MAPVAEGKQSSAQAEPKHTNATHVGGWMLHVRKGLRAFG